MSRFIPKRDRRFAELGLFSKAIVIGGALFVLVGFIAAVAYVLQPVKKPVEKKIGIAERSSVVAFSKGELTSDSLTKMLQTNFQLGRKLYQAEVTDYPAGRRPNEKLVTIVYDENLTSSDILKFRACQNARILIPILFLNPETAHVSLQIRTLLESYRSKEEEPVIKIEVGRSRARKVNWEKIEPEKIPKVVDSYWVDPSLRK